MRFRDRCDAGRRLGQALAARAPSDAVVVGLPRGGVPVAAEVARALGAPLDVVVVRKLGVPGQPELAMGAIGDDGVRVLNEDVLRLREVSPEALATVEARERAELERRVRRYRAGRTRLDLQGRTVVVVDDGVATGATARAAVAIVRALGADRVVLALPVAPPETAAALRSVADEVVVLVEPERMWAVGEWYDDFVATTDDEVVALLAAATSPPAHG